MADGSNPFVALMTSGQAPPEPPPAAAPAPAQHGFMGMGNLSDLGSDVADRFHEAHEAFKGEVSDVTGPMSSDPQTAGRQLAKRSLFGGAPSYLMGGANLVASPVSGLYDWAVGRPVEVATHGAIPKEIAGGAAMFLAPVGAELGGERAANAAAKAMGVSRETYEAHAAASRTLEGVSAAQRAAAKRLTGGGHGPGQGKLDPAKATEAARERREAGAGEPTLLDTMGKREQRVVRAAGARMGDADETLGQHRENVRGDISARSVQRTEELSPYHESVEQRIAALEAQRDDLARTQYRGPYAQPVQSDERLFSVLDSRSGAQAVAEARRTAQERMLDDPEAAQQFHEMGALQKYLTDRASYEENLRQWRESGGGTWTEKPNANAQRLLDNPNTADTVKATIRRQLGWKQVPEPKPPSFPTVSGGTIDRIRIQMGRLGDALQSKPATRARGGGVSKRAEALGAYLDDVPHLQEARAAYRDYMQRIDQLKFDRNISTMRPNEFKKVVEALTPQQRKELIHSVTERLAGNLGKSPRGAQSEIDIDVNGYNARENLRTLLGPEDADRYLKALKLIGESLKKATFVDPSVGSKTAGVTQDVAETGARVGFSLLNGRWHSATHQVYLFAMRHAGGIKEEEARQIAEWAVQQKPVEETLKEIAEAAASAKAGKAPMGANLSPAVKALFGAIAARNLADGHVAAPAGGGNAGAEGLDAQAKPSSPTVDPNNPFLKADPGGPAPASPPTAPAPTDKPAASPGEVDTQKAAQLTGLQGDDLQAALDVMGVESSGQKGRLQPAAFNTMGGNLGAKGIAQWRADRQAGMGDTLEEQLAHVGQELRSPKFAHVAAAMAAQPTIEGKWDVWLTQYEGLQRGGPDYNRDMAALTGRRTASVGRLGGQHADDSAMFAPDDSQQPPDSLFAVQ